MAPSNAAWGYSSAQGGYHHTGIGITEREFWALSRNEKIALFAITTLVAGPVGIMTGGTRMAFAVWRARLIFAGILGYGISSGPGGGGPGPSPISTTTPPSVEETGASLAQLGKPGGPASSSKRRGRPRRKCKPGYRWSRRLRRCVDRKMFPPGFTTIPYIDR